MKKGLFIAIILLFATASNAQQTDIKRFNSIDKLDLKNKSNGENVPYNLNEDLFLKGNLQKNDLIEIETVAGPKTVKVTRVSEFVPGAISVRAVAENDENQVFSFTYHMGRLKGIFHENHKKTHFFRFDQKNKQNYITQKKEQELRCNMELTSQDFLPTAFSKEKIQGIKNKQIASSGAGPGNVINENTTLDVLVAYTRNAESWAFLNGDYFNIIGEIAQAFNLSQTALDNSRIPITLRVVHTHKVDYDEGFDGRSSGERLTLMTAGPDFNPFGVSDGEMDELHTLRDQYGADLVTLMAEVNDTGGIAWRLNTRTGSPKFGFSLNRVQQITSGYTVIHEIGHNMGNSHSRTQEVQTAPTTGGVFHESVGYQDTRDKVHTIMAYGADTLSQIPVFSSSDFSWEGNTPGTRNAVTVENASLSMKKIKSTVASYRLTKTEAPVPQVSTNSVSVNMNREETLTASVELENTGESDLDYSINFKLPDGVILNPKSFTKNDIKAKVGTIHSSKFETNQKYRLGEFEAINSWRAFSQDRARFSVVNSDTIAAAGLNLRLTGNANGTPTFVYSPYFGDLSYGSYRFSYDVRISDVAGINDEQFDLVLFDGITGNSSAGIIIDDGLFYIRDKDESGAEDYVSSGVQFEPGKFHNVNILYNVDTGLVEYSIDTVLVKEVPFNEDGNTPSEFLIVHTNSVSGSYIDIDNVTAARLSEPYQWLSVSEKGGSLSPGSKKTIDLKFSTVGVSSDTYSGLMTVNTNSDATPDFEIPITLEVNNIVSNEEDGAQINTFRLAQNYPNPFNPSTTINFVLPQASQVSLKVYNMLGQEVLTLVNERMSSGSQSVQFDASNLASGMYVYRLNAGSFSSSKKMMLIK
ncbi:MAG: T9SS type A sorting domain-containing protein [Balneola sp.]